MQIIKAFKSHYQNYIIEQLIDNEKDDIDSSIDDVDMLETIYFCSKAWTSVTSDTVEVGISKIGNCLKRSLKSIQTSYGVYALKQIN